MASLIAGSVIIVVVVALVLAAIAAASTRLAWSRAHRAARWGVEYDPAIGEMAIARRALCRGQEELLGREVIGHLMVVTGPQRAAVTVALLGQLRGRADARAAVLNSWLDHTGGRL